MSATRPDQPPLQPMPRFHCPVAIRPGELLSLPAAVVRHLQVLRLQPGDLVTLFGALPDNAETPANATRNQEYDATIKTMGRNEAQVQVGQVRNISREPSLAVHLVVAVPAADRMDWLVEKVTELGVASVQPLITSRSVLRLQGERALKKLRHWQAIAVAACEQSGRNTVPPLHQVLEFESWLRAVAQSEAVGNRWLLSPDAVAEPVGQARRSIAAGAQASLLALSGPEGGLTPSEELACRQAGFVRVSLGPRILRADTAPLALLANLTLAE